MLQGEQITKMRVVKSVGLILGASIIGMLLLWAVYILPTDSMVENVIKSETFLKEQDDSEYILSEEYWKATDRGTNIIILHEVIYPNTGNAFQDALLAPTANYSANWAADWADVLMKYAKEQCYGEDDYVTYARYWHGYLVLLKPLFMFLQLEHIYMLNAIVLTALVACVLLLIKRRLGMYWVAYLFTIAMMHPFNIVQSFQLSSVFYALNITLLLLLIKEWKESQIFYIFVMDGILIAFLDFLTYPYVALAIPMLTYYLLNKQSSLKDDIIIAVKNALAFVMGYVGMWGMKWVFATAFTYENVILNALDSVFHRIGITDASAKDEVFLSVSTVDALKRNISQLFNEQNMIILGIMLVVLGISMIVYRRTLRVEVNHAIVCAVMAVSPLAWIILLTNHCSLHPHLEWRTLSISVFSLAVLTISSLNMTQQDKRAVHG